MKQIQDLCDKIIELNDSGDFKFIATILKEGNQGPRVLGVDWGDNRIPFGTPTDFVDKKSYNDLCFTTAKLARALKVALDVLDFSSIDNSSCRESKFMCKQAIKEIESIFRGEK